MKQAKDAPRNNSASKEAGDRPPAAAKHGFTLSRNMKKRLPESQRAGAEEYLWKKAGGLCALCNLALGTEVDPDHRIPEASGGKTELSNLYLAHKACNSSRQNLPFDLAQPVVEFKVFAEATGAVTFDSVLRKYVPDRDKDVKVQRDGNRISLSFGAEPFEATVMRDPATGVEYFFAEVPVAYVHNDTEVQPRLIMHAHVRKLAIDFSARPMHEPSNCRLVLTAGSSGRLLQFDGQHKTTAQLLLGRRVVPMKIYINPETPMLQELVVKIQQEIKKQPLSKSDTVVKLSEVIQRRLQLYRPAGGIRTERGFIEAQPQDQRKETKQLLMQDLERLVFFDPDNFLTKQLTRSGQPTTDKVVFSKLIAPLIYEEPLDVDMDAAGGRDVERENVLLVLNTVAKFILCAGWDSAGESVAKRRASNFFYQASVGWWMKEILIPTLRYVTFNIGEKKPLFLKRLDSDEEARVIVAVEKLCGWDIWSKTDAEALKAMRSNTVQNVKAVFPEYTDKKLIKEVTKA